MFEMSKNLRMKKKRKWEERLKDLKTEDREAVFTFDCFSFCIFKTAKELSLFSLAHNQGYILLFSYNQNDSILVVNL